MNDRLAFRAMVAVAGLFLFCLGCLLAASLRTLWLTTWLWMVCCSLLMSQMAMPMPTASWPVSIAAILAGALVTLMVCRSLFTAWTLWRTTQRLIQSTQVARLPQPPIVARLAAELKLTDSLIVVANPTPFSFCYGLWRPRICLSWGLVDLLTDHELEAVLRHEAYHLGRREPLRMAVAICLSRFFFFVPLLAELRDRYLAEKELAADAAAVAQTGRAALAGALHKLITLPQSLVLPPLATVAGLSVTAQRVDRLINPAAQPGGTPSWRSIIITGVMFGLSCLLMVTGLL